MEVLNKIDLSSLKSSYDNTIKEVNTTIKEKKIKIMKQETKNAFPLALFKKSLWNGISFALTEEGNFILYDFGAKKELDLIKMFNIVPFSNVIEVFKIQFKIIKSVKKMNSVQFRVFLQENLLK